MRSVGRADSGQAVTEYLVLAGMGMLVLLGASAVFIDGVGRYYLNILKVVCLPFP